MLASAAAATLTALCKEKWALRGEVGAEDFGCTAVHLVVGSAGLSAARIIRLLPLSSSGAERCCGLCESCKYAITYCNGTVYGRVESRQAALQKDIPESRTEGLAGRHHTARHPQRGRRDAGHLMAPRGRRPSCCSAWGATSTRRAPQQRSQTTAAARRTGRRMTRRSSRSAPTTTSSCRRRRRLHRCWRCRPRTTTAARPRRCGPQAPAGGRGVCIRAR